MDYRETFTFALESLSRNKMRTALATLGVVIGIGAVIALVSLGQGSQKVVENQIQSLGSNLLTVSPGVPTSGGVRQAAGGSTTLTYDDAEAILQSAQVTTVSNVSPEVSRRAQVTAGRNNTNTQIVGAVPAYAEIHKVNLTSGSFISSSQVSSLAKVAVLGPTVVTDLFGEGVDPVGQTIRVNKTAFQVIGVTQSKGGSGFGNQDDMIFVPLLTAQKQLFGVDYVSSIAIEAKSGNLMNLARDEVGYFLLARHHFSDPTQADFSIFSQEDILGAANQITGTFTTLLSGIAAISLLVGGIGIMNIMLVTVTERTREIGLRKALGARRHWIISQFLTESVLLTFAGGVLGIIVGALLSLVVSLIINLPFALSLPAMVLAVGVSAAIGIVFGLYPARKAAGLSPIEALRYE